MPCIFLTAAPLCAHLRERGYLHPICSAKLLPAQSFFFQAVTADMENSAKISFVHKTGMAKSKKEKEEQIGKTAEIASSPIVVDVKSKMESDEGVPSTAAALPVLIERNIENNIAIANSTNKMVSPVLLKLRRNQEKRVTPANPVNPVQVPPKQFLGFPAERYMSPTDSIMSPISRGLLARSRRSKRLPPAFVPPKVLDHTFQDAEPANANSS